MQSEKRTDDSCKNYALTYIKINILGNLYIDMLKDTDKEKNVYYY